MISSVFWDNKHKENSKYWLTCTPPADVIKLHGIPPFVFYQCPRILDIGIGNGEMHTYLKELKCDVWSEDISEEALKKVPLGKGIKEDKILKYGPWNFVICHLVLQHMDDLSIKSLFSKIKLTPGGLFSFQFAELLNPVKTPIETNHFYRDLETMEKIAGKYFSLWFIKNPVDYPWKGNVVRWWIMHVT